MSSYPSFACSCCGVTNADMFYDREVPPTKDEILQFEAYRKMWWLLRDDREQFHAEQAVTQRSRKHSDETRAKISASIRRKAS